MIRLFAGIPLPDPLSAILAEHQNGIPGARWVAPKNLHVTLRFIGEVDEDVAADIDAALADVTAPPVPLDLRGLGRYGDRRGARLLWVGVEPAPALLRLHDKVEAACVLAGLEPEPRKFRPHVTLARFRAAEGRHPRIDEVIAANTDWDPGGFVADRFALFSSHLGRTAADYTVEREYVLDGQTAPAGHGDG